MNSLREKSKKIAFDWEEHCWSVTNKFTNRQKKDSHFPHRLDVNQKSYIKPLDIVNKLNIHFTGIWTQTSTQKGYQLGFTDNIRNVSFSVFWFDATETELFNIIKSLDPNKTNG